MIIQIDSREKERAIKKIVKYFEDNGIKYIESKLYAGDYIDIENPFLIIDRKQNIREIATNSTTEQARLNEEMEKVKYIGGHMIFLIEQDSIDGEPIESLDDIMLWSPKKGQGSVSGMRVYRELSKWTYKYPVSFAFCNKNQRSAKRYQKRK